MKKPIAPMRRANKKVRIILDIFPFVMLFLAVDQPESEGSEEHAEAVKGGDFPAPVGEPGVADSVKAKRITSGYYDHEAVRPANRQERQPHHAQAIPYL